MNIFIRAIITGFGFSLGAAVFKKVSKQLGLEDARGEAAPRTDPTPDAAS